MYQGTNKTAIQSLNNIAAAMLELLRERPYGEITVSDLCARARVSRQTFYSLFRSKDNVVIYALQKDCCYSPARDAAAEGYTLRQLCRGFSRFLVSQSDLVRLLTRQQITQYLYDSLYDSFACCDCFAARIRPEYRPYAADFLAAGFTSIAKTYVRQPGPLDPSELEQIAYTMFRGLFLLE